MSRIEELEKGLTRINYLPSNGSIEDETFLFLQLKYTLFNSPLSYKSDSPNWPMLPQAVSTIYRLHFRSSEKANAQL